MSQSIFGGDVPCYGRTLRHCAHQEMISIRNVHGVEMDTPNVKQKAVSHILSLITQCQTIMVQIMKQTQNCVSRQVFEDEMIPVY